MKKNNIARRRGTSVAAAALSFALVAPLAQPIAAPDAASIALADEATDGQAGKNEDDWLSQFNENPSGDGYKPGENENGWRHVYWANGGAAGATQPKVVEGTPLVYDIDAIESGQINNGIQLSNVAGAGKDVVSGRATIVTPRQGGQLTSTYNGFKPVPDTVPIYFQWIDSDGARSPIYRTKTHTLDGPSAGKGMYAFAVPEWIDASGKKHRFKAGMGQRYRVWADSAPHQYGPSGNPGAPNDPNDVGTLNEIVPIRTTGASFPGAFGIASGSALGEFPAAINVNGNMQRTGVWFYERPYEPGQPENNYMKAKGEPVTLTPDMVGIRPDSTLIEDPFGPIKYAGAHRDPVWNRTVSGKIWHEAGKNNQLFNVGDSVGDAPATGAQGYKVFASALTVEGANAYDAQVANLDPWNRAEKAKELLQEHPEYIAGTVFGAPNEKGEYTLRFPESVFPGEGQTYPKQGASTDQFQKHIYVWAEDEDGNVVAAPTNYSQPEFTDPNLNTQWNPTGVPAVLNSFGHQRIYNMNLGLVKDPDLELDITNYNNTTNPAKRGNTAHVEINGKDTLPVGAKLEWRDGNGKVLKSCLIESKSDLRDKQNPAEDCAEFTVPKDAQHGEYYYAALTNGGRDIAVDSFIVLVDGPVWDDYTADPNKQDPVTLTNIGKKEPDTFPKDPVYEVYDKEGRKLPDGAVGVDIDPETGDLTFDPKKQSTAPGEKYTVKVYDQIWKTDPETGEVLKDNGEPILEEKRFVDDATVSYLAVADDYEPTYDEYVYALGNGETATGKGEIQATFTNVTDEDNPVTVAREDMDPKLGAMGDGTEQSKGFEFAPLPEGWNLVAKAGDVKNPGDISIDSWSAFRNIHKKDRGQITFIPPQGTKAGDEYELPVKVTYADGTEDSTTAKITIVGKVADLYDVDYGEAIASAGGKPVTLDPIVTRNTGVPASAPEGTKYELDPDFEVPEGYGIEVDPDTGVITVTPPENATAETEKDFEVPVLVNYPDQTINGTKVAGGQDKASGRVLLDSDGNGVPDIRDVVVTPQDQEVDEGDEITPIEVTPGNPEAEIAFNPNSGNKLPDGLKFENGKITGTPEITDWQPGEDERIIPIEVVVTNPDGSTATETAVVRVKKDPSKHAVRVHAVPTVTLPINKEIAPIPLRVTEANDPEKLADDATIEVFWYDENGDPAEPIEGLEYDAERGAIVGTPTKADENRKVMVRATRDGQTDQTYFAISTVDDTVPPSIADGTATDEIVADGEPKTLDDRVMNPTEGMTGEVRDKDGNPIDGATVTVDPNTGEITVTVPEGTDPQDATVVIKDADGNQVGDPIDVKITEPTPSIDNGEGKVEVLEPGAEEPTELDDKVTNPTEGMTGDVLDKDGNPIDGAEVTVDPETGEITVKVPEDAPTGPATVVIKDADGNQVDDPIHVVIAEPTPDPTSVDDSNATAVDPTNDEQSTGIKIDNLDGDTRVQAKDEDGKVIPVIVDEDGNVSVVPSTDVDGPITVTVTDPDLPGGKTEIEVPVTGHTEGVDDNGSENTTVDPSDVTEVQPTDDEQGTGIKVNNPDDETTVSAKDEDGKDVPAVIDPETGEIKVTPGEDVDGPITVTVTDPDLPGGKTEIEVPVAGHTKGTDDNGSDRTVVPGTKVEEIPQGGEQKLDDKVSNPTDGLTGEVLDKDGNPIDGATVTVDPETGEITVEVPEDAPTGPATVIIKDGEGNVGGPIHIVVTEKPAEETEGPVVVPVVTTVDDSEVTPVDPTDDEQLTGIVVKNPSEDTKVTAVDEDGKEIPVRIDNNGNVRVTPGEDVDGPITVTITDDNLPNGSVDVEVPVNGHEKGVNDNGIRVEVDKDGIKTVEPNGEDQDTGIVVKNPSEDTTVTAVDEDGNPVEVRIDDNGNVVVKPQPGVDGPINVTITDPSLPNGSVEFEVPVAGHEKNRDDNDSDTPADPSGTTVDSSGKTTVQPTDEKQDSGIKVNNPSEDTKVTATDEDGKEIPAEIDEDGNIHLTPGTDVDGPITVTVTDPDLPNGSVEVEVPVDGHSKNVDDNAISVDKNGIQPVQPTDEEQNTGVKVNNPSEDTTVTAVDEDGKEIPAKIDENGNVVVTPGEDVDGPITVTVTDPNLPNGAVEAEVPVDGHSKNADDNGSHAASVTTPDVPADGNAHVVGRVDNPDKDGGYTGKLVDRSGKEIEGGVVEIDPETGEIKVTVPAGTDPREAFVAVRDKDGKRVTDKDGYDLRVNIVAPNYGDDATQVKPGEQGTSKDPFEGQNVTAPIENAEVAKPDDSGDWAFTIDGDNGKITGTAPTNEQLTGSFTKKFPEGTTSWDDFAKQFEGIANPSATGSITLTGVKDPLTGEAKFELVGQDGKSILDPNGDFDGDGVSNRDEVDGGFDPFDVEAFPKDEQADTTVVANPGNNQVPADGNAHTVGKVQNPKGDETAQLVDKNGNPVTGAKVVIDENGNVTVTVPEGTKPGDYKVIVSDKDGNKIGEIPVSVVEPMDVGKCVATSVGFGLPLVALLPLGLATQMEIPGLSDVVAQANVRIQDANTQIQQQLGFFNPQIAAQVDAANKQLAQFGTNVGAVAGGLALIAAGILAGTIIYDNCTPGGSGSSVQDLELRGSSGKTYVGSSNKDAEKENISSSK